MTSNGYNIGHLIGIFIFGFVLFCYPVLSIFNVKIMLLGIPMLFIYIFAVWLGLIFLIYLASRERAKPKEPKSSDSILPSDSLS